MLVHRHHHLVSAQLELLGGALHDADVGLVRNQPIDVGIGHVGLGQAGAGGVFKDTHGQFKDRLAVHLEHRVTQNRPPVDVARHAQDVFVLAVGVQIGGQNAGLVRGFEHHRASAIAKQHTGRAVLEVEDAAENFRPDHQSPFGRAGLDHRIGDRQCVNEAAAHRLDVKRRTTGCAQFVLNHGSHRREHHVGGRCGHDDQVDVCCDQARRDQRLSGCFSGQIAAALLVSGKVPGTDACSLDDPIVRGFNPLLGQLSGQIGVAQASGRQVAAGAQNA